MVINNRNDLENEIRMLQGNVNRMCVTDDVEELNSMKEWAIKRTNEIHTYNLSKLIQSK